MHATRAITLGGHDRMARCIEDPKMTSRYYLPRTPGVITVFDFVVIIISDNQNRIPFLEVEICWSDHIV